MTDRPILFSAPMIRALLDGRKTQTRRVLKPQPWNPEREKDADFDGWQSHHAFEVKARQGILRSAHGIGTRLWVRETWNVPDAYLEPRNRQTAIELMNYAATPWAVPGRWRSPIFMPRWASRLTLTVTDVRVQRVQEISDEDARDEGAPVWWRGLPEAEREPLYTATGMFRALWNSLNAKRGFGWSENPWVAAYTFEIHRCNIDQMEKSA